MTIKGLSLAWALLSAVLLYQASILQKFEQALNTYNKVEKKDFEKISQNLIDNYELEAAKDLVSYTIFDNKKKEELLKEISKKEKRDKYISERRKKALKKETSQKVSNKLTLSYHNLVRWGDIPFKAS